MGKEEIEHETMSSYIAWKTCFYWEENHFYSKNYCSRNKNEKKHREKDRVFECVWVCMCMYVWYVIANHQNQIKHKKGKTNYTLTQLAKCVFTNSGMISIWVILNFIEINRFHFCFVHHVDFNVKNRKCVHFVFFSDVDKSSIL